MMKPSIKWLECVLLCFVLGIVSKIGIADETKKSTDAKTEAAPKASKTVPTESDKKIVSAPTTAGEKTKTDPQASRRTALVWRAVVKVVNPEDARVKIEEQARELGGFPMFFNGNSISLKIPPAS